MSLRFAGYAALFGRRDAGDDVIRPGAFARTLAERRADGLGPLPLYWQHQPAQRIGWVETAQEDRRGLRVIATIDNPEGGAGSALRRGAVSGLSFGYRARGSRRTARGRELTDVDLIEVSLVSHPMQHAARVHMIGSSPRAIAGVGWMPRPAADPAAVEPARTASTQSSRPPLARPFRER